MSEDELIEIIKGLGLSNTRYKFLNTMIKFIESHQKELKTLSNDELINLIQVNVSGASYKVAQCCVLYMRGYYCGIMPVDSGMKDIELPCMGFNKYNNATWWAHLVLIYFKRHYCNKHNHDNCPLKNKVELKHVCKK